MENIICSDKDERQTLNKKQKLGNNDEDDNDQYDQLFVSEYVNDIMNYLRRIEFERKPDPFPFIDSLLRASLVNTLVALAADMDCLLDTVHLTVALIDSLCSRRFIFDVSEEKDCFLLGCLLIACKFEEIYPPSAGDILCWLQNKNLTVQNIISMEKKILKCMEYRLCLPTACQFFRRFSKITESETVNHNLTKYLVELALLHAEWLNFLPSQFSAAAVFLSKIFFTPEREINTISLQTPWMRKLLFHSFCTVSTLKDCVYLLLNWFKTASCNSHFESSFLKYQKARYMKVSLLTAPNVQTLDRVFQNFVVNG